jgi:tetratricopeptide (TPR) repeat protein
MVAVVLAYDGATAGADRASTAPPNAYAALVTATATSSGDDTSTESATPSPTPTDPAPTEPATCRVAEILVEGGEFDKAVDVYIAIAEKSPEETCIETGMLELIDAMKQADADAVVDTCEVVRIFRDSGEREKAYDVLKAYIEKTGEECPGISLRSLRSWTQWIQDNLLLIIAGIVALLLVAAVAVWFARRNKVLNDRLNTVAPPQIVVGEFKPSGEGPTLVASRLVDAISQENPAGDGAGETGSFQIVDAYQDLATGLGDLSKLHASLAPVGAALDVVGRALDRPKWSISGDVEVRTANNGTRKLSCATVFKDDGQQVDSSLYEVSLPPGEEGPTTEKLTALEMCVAGWVQHVARTQLHDAIADIPSAQAYGCLRGGISAHERSDLDLAEELYGQAIDAHPQPGPRYNRAVIALALLRSERTGDTQVELRRAVDILEGGEEDTRRIAEANDVDQLRLTYALAAARAHLAIKLPGNLSTEAKGLFEQAKAAADHAAERGTQFPKTDLQSTALFVTDGMVPACHILSAGVQLYLFAEKSEADLAEARATRAMLIQEVANGVSYRAEYNWACYWSTWMEQFPNALGEVEGTTPAQHGLDALDTALRRAPTLRRERLRSWAGEDPSLLRLRQAEAIRFKRVLQAHRATT